MHIDFGFILEISPGANLRFESAAFKLSHEMTQLLDPGGRRTSPQFHLFQDLCVRGFLAVKTACKWRLPCCRLYASAVSAALEARYSDHPGGISVTHLLQDLEGGVGRLHG